MLGAALWARSECDRTQTHRERNAAASGGSRRSGVLRSTGRGRTGVLAAGNDAIISPLRTALQPVGSSQSRSTLGIATRRPLAAIHHSRNGFQHYFTIIGGTESSVPPGS